MKLTKRKVLGLSLFFALGACGIKGPPLPPVEYSEGVQLNAAGLTTQTSPTPTAKPASSTDKTKAKK